MASLEFSGKTALITGAGSGIGRSIAIAFANSGARVVLAGRRQEELEETARLIREGSGEAFAVSADVTYERSVGALVDQVGPLHVAVNLSLIHI